MRRSAWLWRHAKVWLPFLILAPPMAILVPASYAYLSDSLVRPTVAVVSLLPWAVIWALERRPVFAIAAWLVPLLVVLLVVHLIGAEPAFYVLWTLCVIAIALVSMTERGWRVFARSLSSVERRITAMTMSETDRAVFEALTRAMRPDPAVRRAAQQLDDIGATIRAYRQPAEHILAVPAPDRAWASVIQAAAAPGLTYAEMLERSRPLDYDFIKRLGNERDRQFYTLVGERSWAYRLMTFSVGSRDPTESGA